MVFPAYSIVCFKNVFNVCACGSKIGEISGSEISDISSVESQKGINDVQRCSVKNQKGAIAVQSLMQ